MYTICSLPDLRHSFVKLNHIVDSSGNVKAATSTSASFTSSSTPWHCVELCESKGPSVLVREFEQPFDPYECLHSDGGAEAGNGKRGRKKLSTEEEEPPRPAPFVITFPSLNKNPDGTDGGYTKPYVPPPPKPAPVEDEEEKQTVEKEADSRRWHYRYRINRRGRAVIETNPREQSYWEKWAISSSSQTSDERSHIVIGEEQEQQQQQQQQQRTLNRFTAVRSSANAREVRKRELLVFFKNSSSPPPASSTTTTTATTTTEAMADSASSSTVSIADFAAVDLNCYHVGYPLDMGDVEDIVITQPQKGDGSTNNDRRVVVTTINCPFHDRSFDVSCGDMIRFDYGTTATHAHTMKRLAGGDSKPSASDDNTAATANANTKGEDANTSSPAATSPSLIRFSSGGPPRSAFLMRDECRQRTHTLTTVKDLKAAEGRAGDIDGGVDGERIVVFDSYYYSGGEESRDFASDIYNLYGSETTAKTKGIRTWRV